MSRTFGELFTHVDSSLVNRVATGLAYDSRAVTPGGIFVAINGVTTDGSQFIPDAIKRGACLLISERELTDLPTGVHAIKVENARIALADVSARWFGNPARKLTILAITGSNGKTTSSYLLQSILQAAGERCAVIGTIGHVIGGKHRAATHTTPESYELHKLFADAVDSGDTHVAIEVSSHALALQRVHGIRFAGASWTNLTQDHLDFHGTMQEYFDAKSKLFLGDGAALIRIVNRDDSWCEKLLTDASILSYAIKHSAVQYRASQIRFTENGMQFIIGGLSSGSLEITTSLFGNYNVSNILGVVALADRMGIDRAAIATGIQNLSHVPGRLQKVDTTPEVGVFIDYAHTPDAMEKVLRTAREFTRNRLRVVFGCGGNRDRTKRPLMGAAACIADDVYVTSDNPRFEEPDQIIADILPGIDTTRQCIVNADRIAAIHTACNDLNEGDVLLLLGKGAEEYLEIKGVRHPYSDLQTVTAALQATKWSRHA